MIRTYKYGEVAPEDIFARTEMPANVENIVSEIIDTVRRKPFVSTIWNSIAPGNPWK